MRTQHRKRRGPAGAGTQVRLCAVRPPRLVPINGAAGPCTSHAGRSHYSADAHAQPTSSAPCILVTIGQQTRVYHAFITSAPCQLDAPSTMTLHASTLCDAAGFAADELEIDPESFRASARLILVDAMELAWQRARSRAAGHVLAPVDSQLVGHCALQRWLWRRLCLARDEDLPKQERSS